MEIVSALIGAIVGSIASALLTGFYMRREQQRQLQIQTTINLYVEFQSEDMLPTRIKSDNILDKNRSSERPLSFVELHKKLDYEDWHHVSKIIHFWEKFGVLLETGYLDTKLAQSILGRYFRFYYKRYLKSLVRDSIEKDEEIQTGWTAPITYVAEKILPPEKS